MGIKIYTSIFHSWWLGQTPYIKARYFQIIVYGTYCGYKKKKRKGHCPESNFNGSGKKNVKCYFTILNSILRLMNNVFAQIVGIKMVYVK